MNKQSDFIRSSNCVDTAERTHQIPSHVLNCTVHQIKLPHIVDSEGSFVIDTDGKRYLDLESGVWCTSLGHRNPGVNAIIHHQIDHIMHTGFSYAHPVLEEAAAEVLKVAGHEGGACLFLCSGSEAIEVSRQIARHLTGFKRSMTLHDSYLGSYSSTINRDTGWFLFDWRPCLTCSHASSCDSNCPLLQAIPHDIADFTFEPGSSSGFVRFPPVALIQKIVGVVRGNRGKIIANEVTTGVGRTGRWFGFQHYAIEPDLIAIGKGIGNGYPVSVASMSQGINEELKDSGFHYSQSHQNDPLGASVVREVIRQIVQGDVIAQAAQTGAWLRSQLEGLIDNRTILAVRGRGLMLAIDLRDTEVSEKIHNALLDRGYIVGNRKGMFRLDPPLNITRQELQGFIDAFNDITRCV
jgi:acetylornithine aminotransferase